MGETLFGLPPPASCGSPSAEFLLLSILMSMLTASEFRVAKFSSTILAGTGSKFMSRGAWKDSVD